MDIIFWKRRKKIELEMFCKYWIEKNIKDPKNCPPGRTDGEWDEWFSAWIRGSDK